MTNKERVIRSCFHPPSSIVPPQVPWVGKELKQFWAMARAAGMSKDAVHCLIGQICAGKEKLHDLTRGEFIRLMNDIAMKQVGAGPQTALDRSFAGTPMSLPWGKIRWLQRQLGWSDGKLIAYIKWHGKETAMKIDHISWLTVDKARGIITGMEKIRHSSRHVTLNREH